MLSYNRIVDRGIELKRNSEFLATLASSGWLILMDQYYQTNREAEYKLGYYTLVVDHDDIGKAIPFPVLVQIMGVTPDELVEYIQTKLLSFGWKAERDCALGKHNVGVNGEEVYCVTCHQAWNPMIEKSPATGDFTVWSFLPKDRLVVDPKWNERSTYRPTVELGEDNL